MTETPSSEPTTPDDDPDAGPATTPEDVEGMEDRDQAEGEPDRV